MGNRDVYVSIPRFKLSTRYRLNDALADLGMAQAFHPRKANFSGMTRNGELFLGTVVHQAFIEVNEEGTTAGAMIASYFKLLAEGDEPPKFRADHPFFFLIRDNHSGSILLLGRVNDPSN